MTKTIGASTNPLLAFNIPAMSCAVAPADTPRTRHVLKLSVGDAWPHAALFCSLSPNELQIPFFGLRYLLQQFFAIRIEKWMVDEVVEYRKMMTGYNHADTSEFTDRLNKLAELRYLPLKVDAISEGTVVSNNDYVLSVESTADGFSWLAGFSRSILERVGYSCSAAARSLLYRNLVDREYDLSVDKDDHGSKDYAVWDTPCGFDTEESAALSGMAHLLSFRSSEVASAFSVALQFYGALEAIVHKDVVVSSPFVINEDMLDAYGFDGVEAAVKKMLEINVDAPFSVVLDPGANMPAAAKIVDTMRRFPTRKPSSKVWMRVGNEETLDEVCGKGGLLHYLGTEFGFTVNSLGFRVLDPMVGVVCDGMRIDEYDHLLHRMRTDETLKFAASNVAIGVGAEIRSGIFRVSAALRPCPAGASATRSLLPAFIDGRVVTEATLSQMRRNVLSRPIIK